MAQNDAVDSEFPLEMAKDRREAPRITQVRRRVWSVLAIND
jgi:hypothetical protein